MPAPSAVQTEAVEQEEPQASAAEVRLGLPPPTTEAVVLRGRQQEDEVVIVDCVTGRYLTQEEKKV
jgi:hypothetical protein